ncbi:hypothetical protein O6H91_22G051100 [Diphasiastrum complanatum]|nr:hypothetical protein O6H91_22G051100 [Diphasiastrum complanatum]KAJ7516276.1 hypothetical protein O6H91_22G051100 [Diphasiastrum complanatum]KAJ7516277.1 hypothetical protein O6H91_22G051100 [Diphasiastrum complanatum]KAJ7516278.1 hypothetical protein O6H91_22G051100 [Diphasiastrum complanatum]KAJ7516279.1 hypothetical protein O6H91_22G051100 [Diphasiastrum complanatum]
MQLSRELPGSVALSQFVEQEESHKKFTSELRSILEVIAKTGKYWHDWFQLKILLSFRLKQVLKELQESQPEGIAQKTYYGCMKTLVEELDSFSDEAPFTLQRICELLLCPPNSYSNFDKFMLAFERLLLVTSTIHNSNDPYPAVDLPSDMGTDFNNASPNNNNVKTLSDSEDSSAAEPMDTVVKLPEAESIEEPLERDSGKEASADPAAPTHVQEAMVETEPASPTHVQEAMVETEPALESNSASLAEDSDKEPQADTLLTENIHTDSAGVANGNHG